MEALEFKSRIKDNRIMIPKKMQSKLEQNKDIRVILLIDDVSDKQEDLLFRDTAQKQFLKGYADTDTVYDDY